jgi:carbon monoxide dehydrogenase subunit G
MPYEATVPVHRRLLWPAVIDPERLLGALPNAVIDASGNQGVAGRLRIRMRDQTVTFRGIARIVEVVPTSLRVAIEVEATYGRSGGAVEGVVEITLRAAGSGTRAVVTGNLSLTDESSPLPATETVDAALGRIVRRWFTTLAESSPAAAKPEPAQAPPAKAEPARPSERAPLAVVRDVPSPDVTAMGAAAVANAEDATADTDEDADDSAEQTGSDGDETAASADPHTEREAAGAETAEGEEEAERSEPVAKPALSIPPTMKPAAAKSPTPQVQLRLVSSREDVPPQDDDPLEHGGSGNGRPWVHPAAHDEEPGDVGFPPERGSDIDTGSEFPDDTAEDIWSRLRDRGLPRWIPVVVSAALAGLGSTVLVIVALRRHYRRHHDEARP